MKKFYKLSLILVLLVTLLVFTTGVYSQDNEKKYTEQQYRSALNMLDPRSFDPELDPDIDMYINTWTNSIPINSHGMLVERYIMTHCDDPLNPPRKGAVLKYTNRFSRALLDIGCITSPTTLKGEQEIFYFVEGEGEISGGGKTFKVRKGILALVPAELEFTLLNTGDKPLIMYLINEPIPDGFRPNDNILVKDEGTTIYRDQKGYNHAHWIHNGKEIFNINDGLGTLSAVNIGTMHSMTIGLRTLMAKESRKSGHWSAGKISNNSVGRFDGSSRKLHS